MSVFNFRKPEKKPTEPPTPQERAEFMLYRIMAGDVIMTEQTFRLILVSIEQLPFLPPSEQKERCDQIVQSLRSFLGD